MSSSNPMEKLEQLEAIEKDVANALQSAGQAILELSKEKPSMKQVEQNTSTFLKTLENVETGLQKHITYLTQVSTGQPHEGSSYASQKVLHMAWHRLEHARSRINELERMKHQHLQQGVRQQQQVMRQQAPPPPAPSPAAGAPS